MEMVVYWITWVCAVLFDLGMIGLLFWLLFKPHKERLHYFHEYMESEDEVLNIKDKH